MRTLCFIPLFVSLAAFAMPEQAAIGSNPLNVEFSTLSLWVQVAILAGLGATGVLSHFLRQWYNGVIPGNLLDYLVRDNPRRTVAAVMGVAGGIATAYLMGQFGDAGSVVTLKQVIIPAFGIGYAGDSLLNKSSSQENPQA